MRLTLFRRSLYHINMIIKLPTNETRKAVVSNTANKAFPPPRDKPTVSIKHKLISKNIQTVNTDM